MQPAAPVNELARHLRRVHSGSGGFLSFRVWRWHSASNSWAGGTSGMNSSRFHAACVVFSGMAMFANLAQQEFSHHICPRGFPSIA